MLTSLSIRNIVLIEALDLTFGRGLGVLTGETGAGKSILLDALGLVLGARADSALMRSGAAKASVTASFDLGQYSANIDALLSQSDIEHEAGEPLIIRRQMKADGGSKAFINDQAVSARLLRSLAAHLVELHGQHDDRGLVNARGHMRLLDTFGAVGAHKLARAWESWREAEMHLAESRQKVEQAKADQDLLLAHLSELNAIEPQSGEEARLAESRMMMQKGERLAGDLEELRRLFEGSDSPLACLRVAARRLDRIAPEHALLTEALAALDRAVIEAGEAEDKLTEAAHALLHDPAALDQAETRLFELRALARKHSCTVDELPSKMREMRRMLSAIESGEARLDALEAAAREAREVYVGLAHEAREGRLAAGAKLDKAVAAQLAPLKLDTARFQTRLEELPEDKWGAHGMDSAEFLIATNPGADFAPLGRIASGGELSRFILALKTALAEEHEARTIIFDEIDRGVGGAVASAIGERLARLASGGQVLAVTHSPQVAARGDTHYLIAKASSGMVTRTSVMQLDAAGRQEEIARMLSGAEITDEARAQADRLLERV